ncbi:MAG: flagellar motor protein MotB [Planctomycetota bacterium]
MTRKHSVTKEGPPKVPGYIVTFSDMVTLLLTFFVLLLTLAQAQDAGLYNKGRTSFLASIASLGLGMLPGQKDTLDLGEVKVEYFIVNPDEGFEGRTIDAREEELRRIFQKVDSSMTTMRSRIKGEKNSFAVADVQFEQGSAALNEAAKRFLTDFCLDLPQGTGSGAIRLYVLGLGRDEATEKEQWIVSARRAQTVADFLHTTLPPGNEWPIYSWGAGPGGDWVGKGSLVSRESQILLGVLRSKQ